MEKNYQKNWNRQFSAKVKNRTDHPAFFRKSILVNLADPHHETFPFIVRALIRQTHGEKF